METAILRVLLVDSDRERCEALARALDESEVTSFRVLPVWGPFSEALEKLRRHDFDVVLLGLDHPQTDGLEGLVAVRDARPSVAVVVLADGAPEEDVVTSLKLGAADYLLREDIHPGVVVRVTRYAALRKQTEEAERRADARYRLLFGRSVDPVLVCDDRGTVLEANVAARDVLPLPGGEGADIALGELVLDPGERERLEAALSSEGGVAGVEVRLMSHREAGRTFLVSAASHGEGSERLRLVILRDITDRKRMEDRLVHDALHDALTGLPNRVLFADRIASSVKRRRRDPAHHLAVLLVDIDRFKRVNDTFGHARGDQVLVYVAEALVACTRSQDTVARIGGDEFAILLEGTDAAHAHDAAERMLRALRRPLEIDGRAVSVSASVGIAIPGAGDVDPERLIMDADTALYRAKATGRDRIQSYDPSMREEEDRIAALETELRAAGEKEQLELFYQPIFDAATGSLSGFEALVRWHHPRQGLLPAIRFVRFAEESGLIVNLGEWVIREACRQLAEWDRTLWAGGGFVSVNVSAKQFMQPDLVERIAAILEETGAPPERIKLELTESTLMRNAERTVEMLGHLRDLGLQLWIDDFGTGYSSLSYLQRFPVSALKIEHTFVARMGRHERAGVDEGLVRMILSLADTLELRTIAEGVETPSQLQRLRQLGAADLQGDLLSRPLPHQAAERAILLGGTDLAAATADPAASGEP